jgi:hypothetical protein
MNFDHNDFAIEKLDSFDYIKYYKGANLKYFLPVGYPKLPYITYVVLVPHNAEIESITIRDSHTLTYENFYYIVPTHTKDIDTTTVFKTAPQLSNIINIYSPEAFFPSIGNEVKFDSVQLYAGFSICKIYVCPFKYFPKKRQLFFLDNFRLDITYKTGSKLLTFESSSEKIALSRKFIRNKVLNRDDADKIVPLEEKMDYSKMHLFKGLENKNNPKSTNSLKTKETQPFYIKQIRLN